MSEAMKQEFGLIQRPRGVYYLKNKTTGDQTSLKTRDRAEAERLLQAHNDTKSQPHFNLALARVYINGADPKLATRTWQEVMEHIVAKTCDSIGQCLAAVRTGAFAAVLPVQAWSGGSAQECVVVEDEALEALSRVLVLAWHPETLEIIGDPARKVQRLLSDALKKAGEDALAG